MSYINNMNPRRMIWFNQNAPKNKMDLWLSYNRHYEDTSEDETVDPQQVDDNPSQRKCDLILKAWDCGKWVPIVGFNTTAANKIDTVEGNTLYHPAIFTGENPNDLYDAGSLGSLLSDTSFVSEQEWHDVFNSSSYNWEDIFGDTNWFNTLVWQEIQNGSSVFHLPFATTTVCGGILSDTHTYGTASAFKPIEVKFYPTTNAYTSKRNRLCVSASEVIQQINDYYNDNPSGSTVNIQLANTERIGGIKAAQDPNTADDCRNIPIVLAGPTVGSVWGLPFGSGTYPGDTDNETEYLYLPGWALLEWMKNPYFNQQEPQPFITGWKGVDTQLRENSDLIWVGLSGVTPENTGKFCTIQLNNTDPSGATIDWVDLPEGSQDTWRPISAMISQHEQPIPSGNALYIAEGTGVNININTVGSGTTLTISASGTDYTGTNLIDVSGSVIGIDMSQNPSNGDVIICDSGVAKWGAVPNPKFSGLSINANNGDATLNGLVLSSNASLQIEDEQSTRSDYSLNTWNYYNISNFKSFSIENVPDEMEPIYIRLIESTAAVSCTGDIIDIGNVLSSPSGKDIFITMQFNIAKFEEINVQSTPVIDDQN